MNAAGMSYLIDETRRIKQTLIPKVSLKQKHTCSFCTKSFTFKLAFEAHLKQCCFVSESRNNRTESQQEKRLKCSECDFRTNYVMSIKYHMLKHSGERPFKCTFCTYATIHNSALRRHIRLRHSK